MTETAVVPVTDIPTNQILPEVTKLFAEIALVEEKPTDEQLDRLAQFFAAAEVCEKAFGMVTTFIESQSVPLVQKYGIVVPNAEKSRILKGALSTFRITKADVLTIDDERVIQLKEALEANEFGEYFSKLFVPRTKWEVVEGAEAALKSESLPKRLAAKVIQMWGRCIDVKPKKTSIKITIANPAKPAKKTKKAKGGAQ